MAKDCGEIRLKKELNALHRKARYLRDPETSSSLKSPLSTATASTANFRSSGDGHVKSTPENSCSREQSTAQPSSTKGGVFLHNWRQRSRTSKAIRRRRNLSNGLGSVVGSSIGDDSNSDSLIEEEEVKRSGDESGGGGGGTTWRNRRNAARKTAVSRKVRNLSGGKNSDGLIYPQSMDLDFSLYNAGDSFAGRNSHPESPMLSNCSLGSKMLNDSGREESCYTPSTASFRHKNGTIPSRIGSWDGDDDDRELDCLDLRSNQGCGIPCYWSSKRPTKKGSGSPSLSDALRRRSSSIFCGGSQASRPRRHRGRSSSSARKKNLTGRSSQGLPLLMNGGASTPESLSDELSTNFTELDLEAASRLDGRRWSCCRSPEQLELALSIRVRNSVDRQEIPRSLSQKYRPRSFAEIVGQNVVVQSLSNTLSKGRIAPIYIFQGPRGTGKTSTARIFASDLNCSSIDKPKPCGTCVDCADCASGKSLNCIELDATDRRAIERVKLLLKNAGLLPKSLSYKVFIIDECHLLSIKTWTAFFKLLEELPSHLVFIFITAEPDKLPRTIALRCQRYHFLKIKEVDIVDRLRKLSGKENLDVDQDALELIALHSEGSLRDAETMLEQLSLLGKRITLSLVNDLVGVVPDEKLLDLLELALSSETSETVKRARELMDSGIDPMDLMSQLAGLIMDIIAGSHKLADSRDNGTTTSDRQSLTEAELERLRHALKVLSESEKQLRLSSDRSTWFTAALLQIGLIQSQSPTPSHILNAMEQASDKDLEMSGNRTLEHQLAPTVLNKFQASTASPTCTKDSRRASCQSAMSSNVSKMEKCASYFLPTRYRPGSNAVVRVDATEPSTSNHNLGSSDRLGEIWRRTVEKCHSKTLKQLLLANCKLVAISETEGSIVASLAFVHHDHKLQAERFLRNISNAMESVLRQEVKIRTRVMGDVASSSLPDSVPDLTSVKHMEMTKKSSKGRKTSLGNGSSTLSNIISRLELASSTLSDSERTFEDYMERSGEVSSVPNESFHKERLPLRTPNKGDDTNHLNGLINGIDLMVEEQRLESAWLQAAEKGTPGSLNKMRAMRNQVLPRDRLPCDYTIAPVIQSAMASQRSGDATTFGGPPIKIHDLRCQEHLNKHKGDQCPMSPSLLHIDDHRAGYESGPGPGCGGLLCWRNAKRPKGKKMNIGSAFQTQRRRSCACLGCCRVEQH